MKRSRKGAVPSIPGTCPLLRCLVPEALLPLSKAWPLFLAFSLTLKAFLSSFSKERDHQFQQRGLKAPGLPLSLQDSAAPGLTNSPPHPHGPPGPPPPTGRLSVRKTAASRHVLTTPAQRLPFPLPLLPPGCSPGRSLPPAPRPSASRRAVRRTAQRPAERTRPPSRGAKPRLPPASPPIARLPCFSSQSPGPLALPAHLAARGAKPEGSRGAVRTAGLRFARVNGATHSWPCHDPSQTANPTPSYPTTSLFTLQKGWSPSRGEYPLRFQQQTAPQQMCHQTFSLVVYFSKGTNKHGNEKCENIKYRHIYRQGKEKKTARSSAAMSLLSAVEYSPRWPFVLQDAHSCVNDRG